MQSGSYHPCTHMAGTHTHTHTDMIHCHDGCHVCTRARQRHTDGTIRASVPGCTLWSGHFDFVQNGWGAHTEALITICTNAVVQAPRHDAEVVAMTAQRCGINTRRVSASRFPTATAPPQRRSRSSARTCVAVVANPAIRAVACVWGHAATSVETRVDAFTIHLPTNGATPWSRTPYPTANRFHSREQQRTVGPACHTSSASRKKFGKFTRTLRPCETRDSSSPLSALAQDRSNTP